MKPVRGSRWYSVFGIGVFTHDAHETFMGPHLGFRLARGLV
jgi:hypothetical protein